MTNSSRAALYGHGIFTTVAVFGGKPFLWEKHWQRLEQSAAKLGIDLSSYSEYMIKRGLDESIPYDTRHIPQRARITFADERPSPRWSEVQPSLPTSVSILLAPLRKASRPFRICLSPHSVNSTSPIAGLKTCNYLEQTMSMGEARSRGFNEAIRLNERAHVTSACMANVFWSRNGGLFTPALSTGCLAGTTREFVLENMSCEEVEAAAGEVENADAIFLTSAGLGVIAVDELNGRRLGGREHPITRLITESH